MLSEVVIKNLGVIDHAEVEFSPGLTVLSGETGAGKTMVLTAINLLLGGRGVASMVRNGASKAQVTGTFSVAQSHVAARRTLDAGGDVDEIVDVAAEERHNGVVLSRQLAASGRSKAICGGTPVPASVLASVGETLVAVHGQSDQLLLRSPVKQRDVVDAFGGDKVARALKAYSTAFSTWNALVAELDEREQGASARLAEAEQLREGLTLLEDIAPQLGELEDLDAQIHRLSSVEDLREATDTAYDAITGGDDDVPNAIALLDEAQRVLADTGDSQLRESAQLLREALIAAQEAAADVASVSADLVVDPARLAHAQQRKADITGLMPRFGDTLEDVLAWEKQAAQRLLDLDDNPEVLAALRAKRDDAHAQLVKCASALTKARRTAGAALGKAATDELRGLAMKSATVSVAIESGETFTTSGVDSVELMLQAHSGASAVPLRKGASGGELSRVMLALEVCVASRAGTSDDENPSTFIFDEVDSGVGGSAAIEIGYRLAMLARNAQVVVVTHLPQVAAFAGAHLVVSKHDDGTATTTTVRSVDGDDRVKEIARMLAGDISDTAIDHAAELLRNANERVSGDGNSCVSLDIHG